MKFIWILIIFLMIGSCVDPFPINSDQGQESLVIDGLITDQPGPYTIKLLRTVPINDQLSHQNHETGASITIFDDQGNSELLKETTSGTYQTINFVGAVGRTYHIEIITQDGAAYKSSSETLLPVGEILDLRFEHKKNISGVDGFDVYLDGEVLPIQNKLVRWRWAGTFEYLTFPSLRKKGVLRGIIADPFPCSGFIGVGTSLVQVADCTCCNCWATQYSDPTLLSDPLLIVGNLVSNQKIAFIPINSTLFYSKFHIEVEQMSVSHENYDFWKKVNIQKNSGSDLFQTPAPRAQTNIIKITPGGKSPLGFFASSSIRKRILEITKNDVPYVLAITDTLTESCLTVIPNTTNVQPSFW